jgi:hypothetical protein
MNPDSILADIEPLPQDELGHDVAVVPVQADNLD